MDFAGNDRPFSIRETQWDLFDKTLYNLVYMDFMILNNVGIRKRWF